MASPRKTPDNPFGLTVKQKRFKDKYIETGNGAEAVRHAYDVPNNGSSLARTMASENLAKPSVKAAVVHDLEQEALDVQYVLKRLKKDGEDKNPSIRVKCMELLGKHLKMFTDKVDHTHVMEQVKTIGWGDEED